MVFKVYKEDQNEEDSNPGVSIKVDSAVLQGHISFHSADSSLENSVGSLSTRESDNSKFNYCKKIDISTPKTSILNEKKHPEKKKELRKDIKNIQSKTSVPLKENEDTTISIKNAKSKSITNIEERSLSPAKRYLEFSLSENLKNHCKNKDPEVVVNPINKENWDSLQNCYSTDRKPKMHRISSLKKIGRIPLADITSSYHKRILKPVSADQNNVDIYTKTQNPTLSSKFSFSLKNFEEKQPSSGLTKSPHSLSSISSRKSSLENKTEIKNTSFRLSKTAGAESGDKKSKVLMMR